MTQVSTSQPPSSASAVPQHRPAEEGGWRRTVKVKMMKAIGQITKKVKKGKVTHLEFDAEYINDHSRLDSQLLVHDEWGRSHEIISSRILHFRKETVRASCMSQCSIIQNNLKAIVTGQPPSACRCLSKVGRAGPKPHRASNGIERAFPFLDCTVLLPFPPHPDRVSVLSYLLIPPLSPQSDLVLVHVLCSVRRFVCETEFVVLQNCS